MGAAAGVRLAERLVRCAQVSGAKTDSDFPDFMLYNLPLVGMDETGIIDGASVKRQLHEAFNRLNDWKCDYVLIACNTVHCFYQDMQSWCNGTVLNMIEIACDRVVGKKVGVVCSETTSRLGLYQDAMKRRRIQSVLVNKNEQKILSKTIKAEITGNVTLRNRLDIQDVFHNLRRRGAECIIIGCTELPLVCDFVNTSIPIIDAGAVSIEYAYALLSGNG